MVIRTRVRLLPQWGPAEDYPANPADPPKSPVRANGPDVPVELIPYGCAPSHFGVSSGNRVSRWSSFQGREAAGAFIAHAASFLRLQLQ